jgi:hypothetical protein
MAAPSFDPKAYASHEDERMNYKVTPEGRIIPDPWIPVKHAHYAQPNTNTSEFKNINLNASPYLNNNSNSIHDKEFESLTRKILKGNEKTPQDVIIHWADQLKEYWNLSKLNTRKEFTDRERMVIQFVLNKPSKEIHLETLRSFVRAVVRPALNKLNGGRRKTKMTRRKKNTKRRTNYRKG